MTFEKKTCSHDERVPNGFDNGRVKSFISPPGAHDLARLFPAGGRPYEETMRRTSSFSSSSVSCDCRRNGTDFIQKWHGGELQPPSMRQNYGR